MPVLRRKSTLLATMLGIATLASLGASPAQASLAAESDHREYPVTEQILRSGQSGLIAAFTCHADFPYLRNIDLAPAFPSAPNGMRVLTSAFSFEMTQMPGLTTSADRRVTGWDGTGVILNDRRPIDPPEAFRISAVCTSNIDESYTA